ncbi:hypothetical protein PF005_g24360 [Phytophthora fragariae]|uniref:Uncharacterized protein n=1 Tax=Phytophthora fragariae TaxID=53985 RepID=A0A6A3QHU7_9STRA|nr:hypothetical protein PF009_g24069 [Phytophthora fragariae]KAE8955108.1 hypothetical protein PF011_g31896 [Phytophthora fragariae]KAE9055531.1 hypothetical protein PF010_g32113 [Phytophthora fragariae]KAE9076799.1 hypothetical protein PF007_g24489 [Phytophthora fragariae]KAE9158580.1 hypothetical protein PF004_g31832 [Phytophthora fragariae]
MARKELIFFWESPLFSATQLKRRVWCLQPQQLPSPLQQQQQHQATMAKLAASPAKMLKVLPPVLDKPAASAGADEVVAQDVDVETDAVMEVARQVLAEYKTL